MQYHPEAAASTQNLSKFEGPSWDNTTVYKSLAAPEIAKDSEEAAKIISQLKEQAAIVEKAIPTVGSLILEDAIEFIAASRNATVLFDDALKIVADLSTYATCAMSVDSSNAPAKDLYGKSKVSYSKLIEAYNPVRLFLKLCSLEIFHEFLQDPRVTSEKFKLEQERLLKDTTLSLAEENLLVALNNYGPSAWGSLYGNLSGSIVLDLDLPKGTAKVGLAQAASMMQDVDENVRRAAYEAINKGWRTHDESASSIINALAGWRQEEYQRRSYKKPVHFLDSPLHSARIRKSTLHAMHSAVSEARKKSQEAMRLKAKALGKSQLAPWDLFAPCPQIEEPVETRRTFADAISLIADGYASVHPDMGDFVHMMAKNNWIEGTVGARKRPGGYCTGFIRSREPRIYMTYTGGTKEVMTLAHELGHAFHSWVMRDLPFADLHYPMTLAETASIFGETIVNNMLLEQAKSPQEKLAICWTKARDVEAFLLNIPVRFTFESNFYEKRSEKTQSPDELRSLMIEAWREWYGDTLSDYDEMFWASKLHFSISDLSFYNFPYTFGYLFALGVYAQKDRLGADFYPAYVNLLRDTGRMTAEEVAAKHLNADLTKPDFWRDSIKISLAGVHQLADALKTE